MQRLTYGLAATVLALVSATASAQTRPRAIDRANLDTTCAACSDFYEFANGSWLKRTKIPPDKSSLGSFGMLDDQNQEIVQKIVIDDANLIRDGEAKAGTNDWKIGNYYMACMDTSALDKLGFTPIKPSLAAIAAAKSTDDVVRVMSNPAYAGGGGGGGRGGGGGIAPFAMGPSTDPKNSKIIILSANQGGLVLTREDYIQSTDRATKRRADYVDHITRSLELVGESATQAAADANTILAVETSLAKITIPQADMRDPVATYHKMPLADFQKTTPHVDWTRYLQAHKARGSFDVNVRAPSFFTAMDSLLAATPVEQWQAYMRWHVLNGAMGSLARPFRQEAFRWQQVTTGVQQAQARMKQCASQTSAALGEAVGQDWIKRNFTPEAKVRAAKMVDNLVSALGDRIRGLDWMSTATKAQAIAKLNAFMRKVAYPDKWRDYSTLAVKPGAYYQNQRIVADWNSARTWARLGKAPARDEWSMTPPTVNASYSSSLNQIQFPAGILQPPFFDPNADDAVNYGALGAVIGHEMTHGFDDSGRQFDAQGNLRDWWLPEDAAKYKSAAQKVVDQFNAYTVVDTATHVNGRQTLGENIADLGGLTVAYAAMEKAMAGKPRTKIDGFTPEQRFFLAWAQIWRTVSRDEALIQQVKTDAHSPGKWRVNGPLSNMPEFKAAWGCKDGDAMVRPTELRARIW
jgi:putative endopeptidase